MRGRLPSQDRGAGSVLVVALAGLVLFWGMAFATAVGFAVAQRRAAAAADLAALAGARQQAGCGVAGDIAHRNGARMVGCSWSGPDLIVVVEVTASLGPFGAEIAVPGRARAGPVRAQPLPSSS